MAYLKTVVEPLKDADVEWLKKLHREHGIDKPLGVASILRLTRLITEYELPCELHLALGPYMSVYKHPECFGVSPEFLINVLPSFFVWAENAKRADYIRHFRRFTDTSRNKQMLHLYGLK